MMFGFRKSAASGRFNAPEDRRDTTPVVVPKPESNVVALDRKPRPIVPDISVPDEPPQPEQDYERLAAELGFAPEVIRKRKAARAFAVRHKEIVEFLLDSGIPIYDLVEVEKYMDGLCRAINAAPEKAPEGQNRLTPPVKWAWVGLRQQDAAHYYRRGGQWLVPSSYRHLVPLEMLERVKIVAGKFGDEAAFAVTDYYTPKPDPFLCFRVVGHDETFVIGVWGEPGFGLDENKQKSVPA